MVQIFINGACNCLDQPYVHQTLLQLMRVEEGKAMHPGAKVPVPFLMNPITGKKHQW